MIDINNFAEGTTFEYEGRTIEIHYDVRSLVGIDVKVDECCRLCILGNNVASCQHRLDMLFGRSQVARTPCLVKNNQGFRFYYRLKEIDNVESDGQDASSKDRVD